MKINSPEAQAAVFQSINANNIEQLRATIVNGTDLNFVLDGSTPLIQSIRAGFKDGIELLLENNPQINLQFPDLYDTALNAAIAINNTDLALNLIRRGADINFVSSSVIATPLGMAIQTGNLDFATYLISQGAEIYPHTTTSTPLKNAATAFHTDQRAAIELLFQYSEQIAQNQLMDAIIMLIGYDPNNITNILLPRVADINSIVENNKTLLDIAIERRANDFAIKLIQQGAKIEAEHFEIAQGQGNYELAELLRTTHESVSVLAPLSAEIDINFNIATAAISVVQAPSVYQIDPISKSALNNDFLTVEQAQQLLEDYRFHQSLTDRSFLKFGYTREQISSIIDTPLQDGKTLLSKLIDWNNIEHVTVLLREYGAKVEFEHFKIVREKMTNPYLRHLAQDMLRLLDEAQMYHIEQVPLRTLSDAIKCHPRLADQLLSEGWAVNVDTIMMDLADAIARGNHHVIKILLNHNAPIDWNQQIEGDALGDSLMMKLARDPLDFTAVADYIPMKDSMGLPIFKMNRENKNGQKLIDIFKAKLDAEGPTHMPIISLLRACGSSEPNSIIVPETSLKLDIDNIHNTLNENPFRDIQQGLHQDYDINSLDNSQIFAEIRSYIASNEARLRLLLGDQSGEALEKGLKNLDDIDQYAGDIRNEHNNKWITRQEVVLVYLTAKKIGILDKFIEVITEMHSCAWGMVVNLYKIIQNDWNLTDFRPVIDFRPLEQDQDPLAENVYKILSSSGMSAKMLDPVVEKFFKDISNNVKPKDYSVETELVMGCFVRTFEGIVGESGKHPFEIYSKDIKSFLAVIEALVMSYDADETPTNPLYGIMHANKSAEVEERVAIIEALSNSNFSDQILVLENTSLEEGEVVLMADLSILP